VKPNRPFSILFGAAVLTIALTEYRPVLRGAGNLSDCLFLAAFLMWLAVGSLQGTPPDRLEPGPSRVWRFEALVWGGMAISMGGALASFGAGTTAVSWGMTVRYFLTLCVWLPWVVFALGRYVSVSRVHALYLMALSLVSVLTLSDILAGTRFGLWLTSTPPEGALGDLVQLRYGGPTGHPTTLGYVAAIGVFLSLSYISGDKKWARFAIGTGCLLVFGGALLVSGSRAALLGIMAGLLILVVMGPRGEARRLLLLATSCVGALAILSQAPGLNRFLPVDPLKRLEASLAPRRDFDADWQRRRDLRSAERLLLRDPVTGYGMDNVGTSPTKSVGFNLHNTILQSWMAGGILAGLGTLWLYGTVVAAGLRSLRRNDRRTLTLFAACVAFIVMDMVHPHLYMRFKWFAAALLIATLRDSDQRRTTAERASR
jgi:hypothetical protein